MCPIPRLNCCKGSKSTQNMMKARKLFSKKYHKMYSSWWLPTQWMLLDRSKITSGVRERLCYFYFSSLEIFPSIDLFFLFTFLQALFLTVSYQINMPCVLLVWRKVQRAHQKFLSPCHLSQRLTFGKMLFYCFIVQ